ncbi:MULTISPECIES: Sec-independent protein translocase subunit TatA [unclassified Actinotalea]|uniref:Sec-independent protein translocase subunit TatA n=1 Tax=unclassified Actinotalea TaxID=2638618 RepID=UPI0015F37676|nr:MULTISPECIES: Sec-independent protein translocase subunit TatA [unclassified Actinotalea]
MNLRGWEWLILLAIVLLLFGARRLPDLARSVGKSMKIFRSEVKDMQQDHPAAGSGVPPVTTPPTPSTTYPVDAPPVTTPPPATTPPRVSDDDGESRRA